MKKCPWCNRENSTIRKHCISCGQSLSEKPHTIKNSQKELKGINGWLLLFCVGLFLGVFLDLIVMSSDISFIWLESDKDVVVFVLSILVVVPYYLLIFIFRFYTLYSVVSIRPNAIYLATRFLLIVFLSNISDIFLSAYTNGSFTFSSILYSLIWYSYLNNSKRVFNTFPVNKREVYTRDKILFVFTLASIILITIAGFILEYKYPETVSLKENEITSVIPVTAIFEQSYNLSASKLVMHKFENQNVVKKIEFELISNLPVSVYFVKNEEDFNNFVENKPYTQYKECTESDKRKIQINCTVSSGGIIVYNPNNQKATYTIRLK